MEIILTQSVTGVGKAGELHNVADGYARNYLLPRKLAVAATKGNIRNLEKIRQDSLQREAEARSAAEKVFAAIDGHRLTLPARVSTDGTKLYGSITAQDIATALNRATGQNVDKRNVLTPAIKQVGTTHIPVRVYAGITAHIDAVVYPEGQQPPAPQAAQPEPSAEAPAPAPAAAAPAAPAAAPAAPAPAAAPEASAPAEAEPEHESGGETALGTVLKVAGAVAVGAAVVAGAAAAVQALTGDHDSEEPIEGRDRAE